MEAIRQSVNHNNQKKIALINDYSGFGRCSVAVQLPVISMMKVQCCPVPTSVFSNHTGFEQFYFQDYTEHMQPYLDMWKKLDLRFDAICSGFLGSKEQIDIVKNFIKSSGDDSIVVIDPVMGDNGHVYPTYTEEMCRDMRQLVSLADIVTPNLTEACILTNTKYREDFTDSQLRELIRKVADMGAQKVVITGISENSYMCNLCYDSSNGEGIISKIRTKKIGRTRSGTGDIFSAIIVADAVNGVAFDKSVKKAAQFIKKCIIRAIEMDIPLTDGVPFEEVLYSLK